MKWSSNTSRTHLAPHLVITMLVSMHTLHSCDYFVIASLYFLIPSSICFLSWWVCNDIGWVGEDWGIKDFKRNQRFTFTGVKLTVLAIHPRRHDKYTTGYMKWVQYEEKSKLENDFGIHVNTQSLTTGGITSQQCAERKGGLILRLEE